AVDDFPDVEIHAEAELLEFVDHGDVDAAEDVLHELDHFGRAGGGDGDDFGNDLRVHQGCGAPAGRIHTADNFRDLGQAVLFIAGVFALGREGEIEIGSDVLAAGA